MRIGTFLGGRVASLLVLVVLLTACAGCLSPGTTAPGAGAEEGRLAINGTVVPRAAPPVLDGVIAPGEWEAAASEAFADGGQLFFQRDEQNLYLAIRASEPGTIAANVFLQLEDEIAILHTSAALGTAIYRKVADAWGQAQNFEWRCRSTGQSESAQAERAQFLQEEGWLAANGRMGTPNELEYQIVIPDGSARLAAVIIRAQPPYEKIPWPADLADDTILDTPEGLPLELNLLPDTWACLE